MISHLTPVDRSTDRPNGAEEACLSAFAELNSASAVGDHIRKTDIKRESKKIGLSLHPTATREVLKQLVGDESGCMDLPAYAAATGRYFQGLEDRGFKKNENNLYPLATTNRILYIYEVE